MADLLDLMAECCVYLVAELYYVLVLQVRVRRMVSKESIEELLPEWSCQPDDPQLVNLITDIHAGRFVKGFWEVHGNAEGKGNEKNKKAEPPTKKQNKVKTNEGEAAATGKGSSEEEDNKDSGNNASLMAIANTLDKLSRKFDLWTRDLKNHWWTRSR